MTTGESRLARVRRFLTEDVWDVELNSISGLRRIGVNAFRVLHLVVRGFHKDECPLHASALTFNTLMSIVPILALSLSIARGFGAGDMVQAKISHFIVEKLEEFQPADPAAPLPDEDAQPDPGPSAAPTDPDAQARGTKLSVTPPAMGGADPDTGIDRGDFDPEAGGVTTLSTKAVVGVNESNDVIRDDIAKRVDALLEQIFSYVDRISFAALGGAGLMLLVWSVFSVLGRVEFSFNRVWGVTRPRTLVRKCTDYMGVLLLTPFLVILSSSLPAMNIVQRFPLPDTMAMVLANILASGWVKQATEVFLVALSFSVFIMVMPNTRVRFPPAFCGGMVAAVLFIIWLWICVRLQGVIVRQSEIYGSFAIIPIVLLWVLFSWEIVLFGAEVAFAVQNCTTYRMEQSAGRASTESKIIVALHVVSQAVDAIRDDRGPFDASAYAEANGIPVRLLNEVLAELRDARLLARVTDEPDSYVPLRAPENVRVKDVVSAIMRSGAGPETFGLERLNARLHETLGEIEASAENLVQPAAQDAAPARRPE